LCTNYTVRRRQRGEGILKIESTNAHHEGTRCQMSSRKAVPERPPTTDAEIIRKKFFDSSNYKKS
jgi:hypothetical protein